MLSIGTRHFLYHKTSPVRACLKGVHTMGRSSSAQGSIGPSSHPLKSASLRFSHHGFRLCVLRPAAPCQRCPRSPPQRRPRVPRCPPRQPSRCPQAPRLWPRHRSKQRHPPHGVQLQLGWCRVRVGLGSSNCTTTVNSDANGVLLIRALTNPSQAPSSSLAPPGHPAAPLAPSPPRPGWASTATPAGPPSCRPALTSPSPAAASLMTVSPPPPTTAPFA